MKRLLAVIVLVVLALLLAWKLNQPKPTPNPPPIIPVEKSNFQQEIIGRSVEGRKIEAYTYGQGDKSIIFVGGIHGGYEWNTVLLAYQLMNYLKQNPEIVSVNQKVIVIPDLNPDGTFVVTGKQGHFVLADVATSSQTLASGRFNANKVDLNRNFDCKWKPTGTWQSKTVSAGSKAFSEPEAAAFRQFVLKTKPSAVIFWHSKSGAVYPSSCGAETLPETLAMMKAYSQTSNYPIMKSFTSYDITGAADDWLASINIPAMSVELKTHELVEWEQNLAGVKALLGYFNR